MSEHRLKRVQNLLREQISTMIMRGVIKDPRVTTMISVTEVKVSKDIAYADVYVSSLEGAKQLKKAVEALNHAAGFIQHKLKDQVRLRSTPVLRFKQDAGIAHGFEMSKKLDQIAEELREHDQESTDGESEEPTAR